jgi:hypothetical protein
VYGRNSTTSKYSINGISFCTALGQLKIKPILAGLLKAFISLFFFRLPFHRLIEFGEGKK